jgi:hypothetical protein
MLINQPICPFPKDKIPVKGNYHFIRSLHHPIEHQEQLKP